MHDVSRALALSHLFVNNKKNTPSRRLLGNFQPPPYSSHLRCLLCVLPTREQGDAYERMLECNRRDRVQPDQSNKYRCAEGRLIMRWNIFGSYWNSDNYMRQLIKTVYYYESGERFIHSTALLEVHALEMRTGRRATSRERQALVEHVREQMADFYAKRNADGVVEEAISTVTSNYHKSMAGDVKAAESLSLFLKDGDRLKLALHLWEQRKAGKLDPRVWGAILKNTWQDGKVGCLLLRAKLTKGVVRRMFKAATLDSLMGDPFGLTTELEVYKTLPKRFMVWRGASSYGRHLDSGYSWTLDRNQACWFAYQNAFIKKGEPILLQATVCREAVLALFAHEQEVVLDHAVQGAISNVLTEALPEDCNGELIKQHAQLRVEGNVTEMAIQPL